jgi:hypothetical protein
MVILESVASHDLWIWHPFFGMVESNSDINVLQCSLVFDSLSESNSPQVAYKNKGNPYGKGYYLADDTYPSWSTFVKTIHNPED